MLETTVKEAGVPPKVTLVVPLNPDPVIVNFVPAGPLAGEKPNTDGFTVKLAELVPIPAEFVTVMRVGSDCGAGPAEAARAGDGWRVSVDGRIVELSADRISVK